MLLLDFVFFFGVLCSCKLHLFLHICCFSQDQVLLSMQQKLDNLCQQLDYFKDQPEFATAVTKSTGCGCKQREHHILPPHDVLVLNYYGLTSYSPSCENNIILSLDLNSSA